MTPSEFCYWLQGYLEISKATTLDAEKLECVRKHLELAFVKVTNKPGDVSEIMAAYDRIGGGTRYC